jgi:hypothetical protein
MRGAAETAGRDRALADSTALRDPARSIIPGQFGQL